MSQPKIKISPYLTAALELDVDKIRELNESVQHTEMVNPDKLKGAIKAAKLGKKQTLLVYDNFVVRAGIKSRYHETIAELYKVKAM